MADFSNAVILDSHLEHITSKNHQGNIHTITPNSTLNLFNENNNNNNNTHKNKKNLEFNNQKTTDDCSSSQPAVSRNSPPSLPFNNNNNNNRSHSIYNNNNRHSNANDYSPTTATTTMSSSLKTPTITTTSTTTPNNHRIDKHFIDTSQYYGYKYKLETKSSHTVPDQYEIKGSIENESTGHRMVLINKKVKSPKIQAKVICEP
jgi:hypothetical protein